MLHVFIFLPQSHQTLWTLLTFINWTNIYCASTDRYNGGCRVPSGCSRREGTAVLQHGLKSLSSLWSAACLAFFIQVTPASLLIFLNSLLFTACHLISSSLLDPMANIVFWRDLALPHPLFLFQVQLGFYLSPCHHWAALCGSLWWGGKPGTSDILGKPSSTDPFP